MKTLQREIIKRCILEKRREILTHKGYINNANLTNGEREILHDLAEDMSEKNYGWVIDGIIVHPQVSSYNGETTLSGLVLRRIRGG